MRIDPLGDLVRDGAIRAADRLNLNGNKAEFKHTWELVVNARKYAKDNHELMVTEVEDYLDALGSLIENADLQSAQRSGGVGGKIGMNVYTVADDSESYVIFSDIHMTARNNRQGFFRDLGNKALYLAVLEDYYATKEFTLIENGDIEELLIYEPIMAEIEGMKKWDQDQIDAYRDTKKLETMNEIVNDHDDYYRIIYSNFIADGRYHRTKGNHDYDLGNKAFVDIIEAKIGVNDWPHAVDVVLLSQNNTVSYAVCHGHQFDTSCVPTYAKFMGESFSMGAAWAYQGPDRYWTQANDGTHFLNPWLDGTKPFINMLVQADVEREGTGAQNEAGIGYFLGSLNTAEGWEALYQKNIAWEYFISSDPKAAMKEEVETGNRWIKFRHMDEVRIVKALDSMFGADGLKLILGHSHEPRINAGTKRDVNSEVAQRTNYINSAAAGRFENLIWGVEIIQGTPNIISWHRDLDSGEIKRTVWKDVVENNAVVLLPSFAVPLEPETESASDASWLAETFPLFS